MNYSNSIRASVIEIRNNPRSFPTQADIPALKAQRPGGDSLLQCRVSDL